MARIDSLQRERESYVRRGLPDRVAQVDAEMERLGHRPEKAQASKSENAARPSPSTPRPRNSTAG